MSRNISALLFAASAFLLTPAPGPDAPWITGARAAASKKGKGATKKGKKKPAPAASSEATPGEPDGADGAVPAPTEPTTATGAGGGSATDVPDSTAPGATERAKLHFSAGRSLMDLGRFNEAAAEFSAGHALLPRAAFLYNVGQALWFAGKLAPALASFSRAEKFTPPPDPELMKSIKTARAAVRAESRGKKKVPRPKPPSDPVELAKVYYELAGNMFDMERFSEAMKSFRSGYKLAARPGFLLNMAVCLYELGEYDEAIRHAEAYISHAGPLDPNAGYAGEIINKSKVARSATGGDSSFTTELVATATGDVIPPPKVKRKVKVPWWAFAGGGILIAGGAASVIVFFLTRPPEPMQVIDDLGPLAP